MSQLIKRLLNGPGGRDLMRRGRHQAAKPGTQQKLQQLVARLTGRSGRRR
ncbi:hypothetical protein [Micromonospora rubida]